MKKANTFLKFLETVHPLSAEVYYDTVHDIKVYKTTHSFEEREHLTRGRPLGVPENRSKYYQKCTTWVYNLPHHALQEYLFYDTTLEQGMIMAYRPDSLQKGKWCLVIVTILPYKRREVSLKHPTKRVMLEKLIRTSQMPSLALQYILDIGNLEERLQIFWESTKIGEWDAGNLKGSYGIDITMDKNGIMHITTDVTHKALRLVEV